MRPKEPSEPSYGLQFNDDDDSDGNQKYNYANDDALLMQQASMNFQDDQMNMFQVRTFVLNNVWAKRSFASKGLK